MSSAPSRIETERLVLRPWRTSDREPFAALNADPDVMRYVSGKPLTRAASDASVDRFEAHWREHGYGLYAVELRTPIRAPGAPGSEPTALGAGTFVGFIGTSHHRALPAYVEIGWRLTRYAWGMGLATEGALAVRDMAYRTLGLPALISITVAENRRSQRVMDKLGLAYWREMPFEQWHLRIYRGTPDRAAPETRGEAPAGTR